MLSLGLKSLVLLSQFVMMLKSLQFHCKEFPQVWLLCLLLMENLASLWLWFELESLLQKLLMMEMIFVSAMRIALKNFVE